MCPVRKVHASRRKNQTRQRLIWASAVILIAVVLAAAFILYPKSSADSQQNQAQPTASASPSQPPTTAFEAFTNHYMSIMQNLNSTPTKTAMATYLNSGYNQTDLFAWEQSKLTFTEDPAGWCDDPVQILSRGKGICEQFSVVYVSACLALGYQSRLVVAVDSSTWSFIHVWAEAYYNNGVWVHVDPSDSVWNNPSRYQGWDWGSAIGGQVKVYAFEDNAFRDVTASYSANST
jgi:transglutaminase-like putative cysteine protease